MRALRTFLYRLTGFWHRDNKDRELREELESHLQMQIEDNLRSGMTPAEARRAALAKAGGLEPAREACRDRRGLPFLETVLQDFSYGLRQLRRSPGFAAVVILTLALAIGANTAMFSIIHSVLLKPLAYRDPAQLVLARCTMGGAINPSVSAPDYYDYREQAGSFEGFSAVPPFVLKTTVQSDAEPERAAFTFVAHDFFRTLGVAPKVGRWFSDEEGRPGGPNVVIVSEHLAQRRFGTAARALGSSLSLNGRSFAVVGVMPAAFRFLLDVDVWAPMRRGEAIAGAPRQFHNWLIVGRLKPGVSLQGAQRELDVISKRLEQQYPASNEGKALRIDPLQAALAGGARRLDSSFSWLPWAWYCSSPAPTWPACCWPAGRPVDRNWPCVRPWEPRASASPGNCCSRASLWRCSPAFSAWRWPSGSNACCPS